MSNFGQTAGGVLVNHLLVDKVVVPASTDIGREIIIEYCSTWSDEIIIQKWVARISHELRCGGRDGEPYKQIELRKKSIS